MRRLLCVAPLVALSACGAPTYKFTSTTTAQLSPKAKDCTFAVANALDDAASFQEIGVLEDPRFEWPNTLARFKEIIQPYVCDAGGDAVVPEINGNGIYVRGVVYRRRAQP